ncbi:MAG: YceI family protein [Chryseolinea sp.]
MATFQIQKAGSTVNWTGKKVLGPHTGSINVSDGYIELDHKLIKGGVVSIDMNSIVVTDIEDPKANRDLKSHLFHEDFFSVEKFPKSKLRIESSTHVGGNQYKVQGILTIKDISHPVTFTATVETFTDTLHSLGEIVIDRTIYNIRYGSGKFIDNLGDKLVYDDFVLQFKLVAQRQN